MAVVCGDKNLARNILFEDIRIESIQEGMMFNIRVNYNPKYDKQPGRGIDGLTFRNIMYDGIGENKSVIFGFDENRRVKNVTFENIVINGKKMKDTKDFVKNEFVDNIVVK